MNFFLLSQVIEHHGHTLYDSRVYTFIQAKNGLRIAFVPLQG
jgi:hypothetical protein